MPPVSDQPAHAPSRPAGSARRRVAIALLYGAVCHALFGAGVLAMIVVLHSGMTLGQGHVPWPWSVPANALLLVQFPLAHSLLLTGRGRRLLTRLAPAPWGGTLVTTTFAIIASVQLLVAFALWTPSGVVWWRAEGAALWVTNALFAFSWLLLMKASLDAGPSVQGGWLGWTALLRGRRPMFPDMPETGLFRVVRQPIYVAFALTLWTVPVWTPDQLAIAVSWTAYCVLAPRLKERRFERLFGARFAAYRARTPYWLPLPRRRSPHA